MGLEIDDVNDMLGCESLPKRLQPSTYSLMNEKRTMVKFLKGEKAIVEDVVKKKPKYKWERNKISPMTGNYLPELYGTPELDTDHLTLLQELIGVQRWATKIGRVSVLHKVTVLSQYQALAREGYL